MKKCQEGTDDKKELIESSGNARFFHQLFSISICHFQWVAFRCPPPDFMLLIVFSSTFISTGFETCADACYEWLWGDEGNPQKFPWTGKDDTDYCHDCQCILRRHSAFPCGWHECTCFKISSPFSQMVHSAPSIFNSDKWKVTRHKRIEKDS